MSRLKRLYQAMDTLIEEGLSLSPEQEQQLREAEEQIIRKEILPVLSEKIEPLLSQIQRELALIVEYHPNESIKVSLLRKIKVVETLDAKPLELDSQVQHKEGKKGITKQHISPKTGLCVYLPDGSFIQEKKACDTFVKAVQAAGVINVRNLGYTCCHVPIVSNTIDNKYGRAQHSVGGGLYVLTHSNTKDKKKMLDRISQALHLNWRVEIVS